MSFYKQLTVKIELFDNDDKLRSTGSGIVCVHKNRQYVLTAYHCLNPKDAQGITYARPDGWKIRLFTENDIEIEIVGVTGEIKDKDIAIIEVNHSNQDITEDKVQLFTNIVKQEHYCFRGFPKFLNYKAHTFKVSYNDDNWWIFELQDISSERKAAVNLLEGASGSGIFFCRREKYFIVGVALHLHDVEGSLNEVYVAPISEFKSILPASAFTTFSADMLSDWENGMDKDLTEKQIEELKQEQIEWIDNIVRKLKVMYPEQYQQKLKTFLGDYVKGRDFFIKQGESNSTFRDQLSSMTQQFFEDNQPDPKIYVDTAGEAIDDFRQLRENLVKEMSELIPEDNKSNRVCNSYAKYRLTERLLECTLEYLKRTQP